MTVGEMVEKLDLKVVSLPDDSRVINAGYVGDLLSWVMGKAKSDNVWITIMSNINIIAVASLTDVSCIILAEGVEVDSNVVETANNKGVNILSTDKSAFEISALISDLI